MPRKNDEDTKPLTYRDAGVDIDAGDALVERIKPHARRTFRPEVLGDLGGFGGLFAVPRGYTEPVLVSGTDGVGTKLKVAFATGRHDTIGIDLVAMCVNDVAVSGAEPLFFLDYFATGKLDVDVGEAVVTGIAEGCRQAGCALIGGETAELPGMYADGEYDLAGFAVGVVERRKILDGKRIAAGRRGHRPGLERAALERLLAGAARCSPLARRRRRAARADAHLRARASRAALAAGDVKRLAHITGGGLVENPPRILGDGLVMRLDERTLAAAADLRPDRRVGRGARRDAAHLQLGLGLVAVVAAGDAEPRARGAAKPPASAPSSSATSRPAAAPRGWSSRERGAPMKVGVLVSGSGTNLQALLDADQRGELGGARVRGRRLERRRRARARAGPRGGRADRAAAAPRASRRARPSTRRWWRRCDGTASSWWRWPASCAC